MKKILLIALILFTTLVYSQKPKVSAVRYTEVTTTERDNYSVPVGEFWRIYNTTTTQNEYWDGDSWEALSISEATFNLNSKNYSWGESYINNWRDLVLDDGATYFPNNGGYEKGRLHQAGIIPSLHFIPAAVEEAVLYSIGKNRTNDLTVDRAALATYIDEDRILRTAAFHVARIDYTDGDGAILAEDEITNLSTYSEDLTQWILSNATVTANNIIAPDGAMTADKFEFTVTDPISRIRAGNQMAFSGDDFVASFFIKKGNSRYVTIKNENMTTIIIVGFDLDLVTAQTGGTIKEYKNGWFRLSITENINGDADKTGPIYVILPNSLGSVTSVSGNYGYLWGGQAEDGIVATSYIKTEGTTVTRLKDVISGAGSSDTFNSFNGTFRVNIKAFSNDLSERYISISDGTTANRIMIGYNTTSQTITALIDVGSVNQATLTYAVSDITEFHDCVFTYELNSFSLWVDGIERDTDSSGSVFSIDTLDELNYDNGGGGNDFYGRLELKEYFKEVLTDNIIQQL